MIQVERIQAVTETAVFKFCMGYSKLVNNII